MKQILLSIAGILTVIIILSLSWMATIWLEDVLFKHIAYIVGLFFSIGILSVVCQFNYWVCLLPIKFGCKSSVYLIIAWLAFLASSVWNIYNYKEFNSPHIPGYIIQLIYIITPLVAIATFKQGYRPLKIKAMIYKFTPNLKL